MMSFKLNESICLHFDSPKFLDSENWNLTAFLEDWSSSRFLGVGIPVDSVISLQFFTLNFRSDHKN
jgi:hypothetical protein